MRRRDQGSPLDAAQALSQNIEIHAKQAEIRRGRSIAARIVLAKMLRKLSAARILFLSSFFGSSRERSPFATEIFGRTSVAQPHAGMMVTTSVRLVRPLTEGGMGSVWVAEHEALHTQVVVKFISAEFADKSDALARFTREAAAAAQVKSPHVVHTLDHGVSKDGAPYIVMEHLEGRDLAEHLEIERKMRPRDVAEVVSQLSRALEKAHARGIVHRDIKPNNIFLCDAGDGNLFVKLLDFGIAKMADLPKIDSGTKTGAVMGSPYYMSPEQVVGSKDIDFHTDLWSVGVVAFEALTGHRPFEAETVGGLAVKIHSEPLPIPSQVDPMQTAAIDAWFVRACARAPSARFSSAKEMADALAAAITGEVPQPISLSTGPRSADPSIDFAKTDLDARAATDAGLGVPTTSTAPGKTIRTLVVGAGLVALLGVAAFGGTRLFQQNHAVGIAPGPSTSPDQAASATAEPLNFVATPAKNESPTPPLPSADPAAQAAQMGSAALAPSARFVKKIKTASSAQGSSPHPPSSAGGSVDVW